MAEGGKKIDLILCDSVMPVMAGPAAVKLMREHGFTGPILGCTGNTLPKVITCLDTSNQLFLSPLSNQITLSTLPINSLYYHSRSLLRPINTQDVEDFKAHGVNDVLGKPVKMQTLKNFMVTFGLTLPAKLISEKSLNAAALAAVQAVTT